MFIAFSQDGDEEAYGRMCFIWEGIPSLTEVMERAEGSTVTDVRIEVPLDLPIGRVNAYEADNGRVFGSYDGQTLLVETPVGDTSSTDSDERAKELRAAYDRVTDLFFQIVHGFAQGMHPVGMSAHPQSSI